MQITQIPRDALDLGFRGALRISKGGERTTSEGDASFEWWAVAAGRALRAPGGAWAFLALRAVWTVLTVLTVRAVRTRAAFLGPGAFTRGGAGCGPPGRSRCGAGVALGRAFRKPLGR